MMVGHCQTHPHHPHEHRHYHPHHQHSVQRAGSESSTSTRDEQFSNSGTNSTTSSSNSNNGSPSEYSLTLSSDAGDRSRHLSTASLLDSIERRTQRTYRYGIGLVCVGATLNWLGFAQVYNGTTYIDPLRYLGVACVLTGSFCVCLAMCRWLGRPISVSGHHVTNLEDERSNGDVHVINVAVPMYVPSLQEDYRPTKPPDYEQIVAGEPPPYDEAIKLSPGAFITSPAGGLGLEGGNLFASHYNTSAPCQASPSHLTTTHITSTDLTRALLLDNEHEDTSYRSTPSHRQLALLGDSDEFGGSDPPPAYEPSPRPSISSCSSSAPLIPTSTSRFELPPSFAVRRLFGGGSITGTHIATAPAQNSSPYSTPHSSPQRIFNMNEHLHEIVIEDSVVQNAYLPVSSVELSNNNNHIGEERIV
ncbi:unnamed protein product [Orchesella dallaii]|uniref:Transmembrane protein n=1 Tax=Orchesella dallaii TaxID=48710 RepID=A0ABP1PQM0_9HEXA